MDAGPGRKLEIEFHSCAPEMFEAVAFVTNECLYPGFEHGKPDLPALGVRQDGE